MTYLLDVSTLLAMGYEKHVHNIRVMLWLNGLRERQTLPNLAVCSITEIGFVRVATGAAHLTDSVRAAQEDLNKLKNERQMIFVNDTLGARELPPWVQRSRQVTDGHLVQLAALNHAQLATLDKGIPGALFIPEYPDGVSAVKELSPPLYGELTGWERERLSDAARFRASRDAAASRNVAI